MKCEGFLHAILVKIEIWEVRSDLPSKTDVVRKQVDGSEQYAFWSIKTWRVE